MRGLKNLKNPGFQKWEPFLLGGQVVDTKTQKEYERLDALFQDVDPNKTKLVDELLKKGWANLPKGMYRIKKCHMFDILILSSHELFIRHEKAERKTNDQPKRISRSFGCIF